MPFSRRRALQMLAGSASFALAGCSAALCSGRDRLELQEVPSDVATASDSIVIQYRDLGPDAQRAVERAAASGQLRQCHSRDSGQSDIMELYEQIEREWEKHEDIGEPKGERTYIQYENEYYAIKLGALDADYIDSIHV